MIMNNDYYVVLLEKAQAGNEIALNELLTYIRDRLMNRRIGKYISKNRQVDNDDIRQEFMIGVALNIHKAQIDVGDPIEFLVQQGIYRVRTYMRANIIKGTTQICRCCGNISRLHKVGNSYTCKKCGSYEVVTQEMNALDDGTMLNTVESTNNFEIEILSNMIMDEFEKSLPRDTNVYQLYILLKDGINRDNPEIKNYIKEIATMWQCSQSNIIQTMEKLKTKVYQFARENGMEVVNNKFVTKDGE